MKVIDMNAVHSCRGARRVLLPWSLPLNVLRANSRSHTALKKKKIKLNKFQDLRLEFQDQIISDFFTHTCFKMPLGSAGLRSFEAPRNMQKLLQTKPLLENACGLCFPLCTLAPLRRKVAHPSYAVSLHSLVRKGARREECYFPSNFTQAGWEFGAIGGPIFPTKPSPSALMSTL